jgi:DNA-binding transcriptional LysR family regulator
VRPAEIAESWPGLHVRQLIALRAVVDEGSFGRAAARLGYTQSAVSHQIATLERVVGTRLLNRPEPGKPLTVTPAGRIVLDCAVEIVTCVDNARREVLALRTSQPRSA